MRESRSYGSVGEPVGNHRLYPEEAGGEIPPPTRFGSRAPQMPIHRTEVQEVPEEPREAVSARREVPLG